MLTASSFAKVSGKLGALGKPLGLTAEMASVTMLPGPIEVRNHHSSAQSSAWGRMGWGKAALAPASSECSHQHFSLLSNIHPKNGPFASCPCQLFIYYKMHFFFVFSSSPLSFPKSFFLLLTFQFCLYLWLLTPKYKQVFSMWQMLPSKSNTPATRWN